MKVCVRAVLSGCRVVPGLVRLAGRQCSFVALLNQGLGLTGENEQFETYKLILYFVK